MHEANQRKMKMEAIEFIKAYRRLCNQYIDKSCEGCPFTPMECGVDNLDAVPERLVKVTEEWAKEHPVKTRMEDFFEKYPNAPKNEMGIPKCCVESFGYPVHSQCYQGTYNCKECWSRPIE